MSKKAQQDAVIEDWAQGELARMPPQLAATVQDVIFNDAGYKRQAAAMAAARPFGDPTTAHLNFVRATAIAQERLRSVGKANRARPVRTSSGHPGSSGSKSGGIDAAIANAMRSWGD